MFLLLLAVGPKEVKAIRSNGCVNLPDRAESDLTTSSDCQNEGDEVFFLFHLARLRLGVATRVLSHLLQEPW